MFWKINKNELSIKEEEDDNKRLKLVKHAEMLEGKLNGVKACVNLPPTDWSTMESHHQAKDQD